MAGKVTGKVIAVDEAGNLLTDIHERQLDDVPRDERTVIACDGHKTFGIFPTDHGQPELTLLAVLNEQQQLMLMMVDESAHAFLGIGLGSVISVSWT